MDDEVNRIDRGHERIEENQARRWARNRRTPT